jgi:glycosyltransferase involved in cell wall biosynthesis
MRVIPFLNKNHAGDRDRLTQLYLHSDFFLLPTRLDCSPIVTCEACAFGLPVISTQTGGVPEIVRQGVNGYLLPMEARGAEYAEVIRKVYLDAARYQQMRKAARVEFETRLNWDAWGMKVATLLKQLAKPAVMERPSGVDLLVRD